jgi:hypothetical protein
VKKVVVIIGGTILIMLAAWHQSTASALLAFFVTGHIPGTTWTIPFWGMMAFYCLLITILVTNYVEEALTFRRDSRAVRTPAARMPRRRYGHI